MKLCKVEGTYFKVLKKLSKTKLLILDDFGLQAFDNFAREAFMDIIDERFGKALTIISSQLPVSSWYDIIAENTIADALFDRIVNYTNRINIKAFILTQEMPNKN